jgi:uncharacterized membrane protein
VVAYRGDHMLHLLRSVRQQLAGLPLFSPVRLLGHAPLCNGKPERSLRFGGFVLPLCCRCTGALFGATCGVVVKAPLVTMIGPQPLLALLLSVPLCCDGALQYLRLVPSTNSRRLATGFLCGLGLQIW